MLCSLPVFEWGGILYCSSNLKWSSLLIVIFNDQTPHKKKKIKTRFNSLSWSLAHFLFTVKCKVLINYIYFFKETLFYVLSIQTATKCIDRMFVRGYLPIETVLRSLSTHFGSVSNHLTQIWSSLFSILQVGWSSLHWSCIILKQVTIELPVFRIVTLYLQFSEETWGEIYFKTAVDIIKRGGGVYWSFK